MNRSVKVRMTAIMLLILIVLSSSLISVLADSTITDTYSEESEQTEITEQNNEGSEADVLADRFFRIRNIKVGGYLSFVEGDNGPVAVTGVSDTQSSAQCFRFIPTADDTYLLNSAFANGAYSLSVAEIQSDGEENARKVSDDFEGVKPYEDGFSVMVDETKLSVGFSVVIEENGNMSLVYVHENLPLYFVSSEDGLTFSSDSKVSSEWVLEEVSVKTISMAYFETRLKLYSVQQFYVKVTPAVLQPFVEWTVDNEDVMLVSEDGTVCALSVGEATLTAKVGTESYSCRTEVCDSDAFTWYSQDNVTNSYWNGGALSGIYFRGRMFASNTARDWMREGCALTCCAMLFRNLGATYTNGYDFRSGQQGDLPADPYTLALANIGHTGFTSASVNYNADPVLVRWSNITNAFRVDGRSMSYTQKYTSNLFAIRDALKAHPEGVVVRMVKSNGETHFVLFTECVNPTETKASKLKFIIYDPMSADGSDGDGVPFEQSASYRQGYRYSSITSYLVWNVN